VIVGLVDIYTQIPRREEVRELMRSTELSVREQPGCISYTFAETLDDPGHYVVVQEWRDEASVAQHYASPAFAEYQERIAGLLVRTSELRMHVVTEGFRPIEESPPSITQED
jgi:quinol monooxygenase YgiN